MLAALGLVACGGSGAAPPVAPPLAMLTGAPPAPAETPPAAALAANEPLLSQSGNPAYKESRSGNVVYRDSARKALDFILIVQYPLGGLPQAYPARTGTTYSKYVTFNDNAMVRALILLDQAEQQEAPLDTYTDKVGY